MSDLLELLGAEWSTTPAWTPIYAPSCPDPMNKQLFAAYLAAARCRDCGCHVKHDRGGADNQGAWFLCHGCGLIEDLPRWGWRDDPATGYTLEVLIEKQQARRRRYEVHA